MLLLTPAERRDLRARAHRLQPVVSVGQHGLTESVLHEIDVNLRAHELIKVRVFNADHDAREAVLARICAALEAAPVQHIGKLLVLWRPAPEEPVPPARDKPRGHRQRHPASAARAGDRARRAPPRAGASAAVAAAKSKPQARRPREPAPRTPVRPPAARGRRTRAEPPAAGGRRRRGRVQGL